MYLTFKQSAYLWHLTAIALLLLAEKYLLGSAIYSWVRDSQANGLAEFLFAHGKMISRSATLALVLAGLLMFPRYAAYRELYRSCYQPWRLALMPVQLLALLLFYAFAGSVLVSESSLLYQFSLVALFVLVLGITLLALAPREFWQTLFIRERYTLLVAAGLSLLVWGLAASTQGAWETLSGTTFFLVVQLLVLVVDPNSLYVHLDDRIIGIDSFLVNVDAPCSGYEGIGLIIAFASVYLYLFREDFRFPRALLIYPIGIAVIWVFNLLRIVALILIGRYWSADVAVWGFHAQAGWMAFIAVSILLMILLHHLEGFRRLPTAARPSLATIDTGKTDITTTEIATTEIATAEIATTGLTRSGSAKTDAVDDWPLARATLVPLIALLSTTLLTSMFSAGFDWLYPLRVVVVALALVWVAPQLPLRTSVLDWKALASGVLIAGLWILLITPDGEADQRFAATLSQGGVLVWLWLLVRVAGAVVTVPIAEELAFRGFLLCRLAGGEIRLQGRLVFALMPLVVSSLAFGLLHGAWLAGTLAGLVLAGLRYRTSHISQVVAAHSLANLLIFIYACATGAWSLM